MKEKLLTAQLRSTIFFQQSIGYTPETAKKLKNILQLQDSKEYGIPAGVPMLGVNPTMPQYGMPWRIFKKCDDGSEYNIAFQPGKIDIVLAKEASYQENIEGAFCEQSIGWLTKIMDECSIPSVVRIAYAPLYSIPKDSDFQGEEVWKRFLKNIIVDGAKAEDINLQFVIKNIVKFGNKDIQMNFHHHIFDGKQTRVKDNSVEIRDVLLFQLDLNSIPEKPLSLDKNGVRDFFNGIIDIKNKLIDNVEA